MNTHTLNFLTEYDALRRLGIEDPKGYITRRYCATSTGSVVVVQLASCAIGETVLTELEGAVDDIHSSEIGWIDVLVSIVQTYSTSYCLVIYVHVWVSEAPF